MSSMTGLKETLKRHYSNIPEAEAIIETFYKELNDEVQLDQLLVFVRIN